MLYPPEIFKKIAKNYNFFQKNCQIFGNFFHIPMAIFWSVRLMPSDKQADRKIKPHCKDKRIADKQNSEYKEITKDRPKSTLHRMSITHQLKPIYHTNSH